MSLVQNLSSSFNKNKVEKSSQRKAPLTKNSGAFSVDKKYSLVEVISLLKYMACKNWGSEESLQILLVIASLRESLLKQSELTMKSNSLDAKTLMKELTNADVKLGKVLRDLDILCTEYNLTNPVRDLTGDEAKTELYKLAKIDKDFYAKKDALVITRELYQSKQEKLGSEFFKEDVVYELANIKFYDTILYLMIGVADYTDKYIAEDITDDIIRLRDIVAERKAIDNSLSKGKNLSISELDRVEDLARELGEITCFFEETAFKYKLPNGLRENLSTRDIWQKYLSSIFEVLGSLPTDEKQSIKETLKVDKTIKKEDISK